MQVTASSPRRVIGYANLTVSNTPIGFTPSTYTQTVGNDASNHHKATSAFVTVETQEIRAQFNPAVTVEAGTNGHAFASGAQFTIDGAANIANVKFIKTGGSDATLRVTFFG